jgi:hypothetical protein
MRLLQADWSGQIHLELAVRTWFVRERGYLILDDTVIPSANIKHGQVTTNVLGLFGRFMLQALADGEVDAEKLAQLAKGKLKAKAA